MDDNASPEYFVPADDDIEGWAILERSRFEMKPISPRRMSYEELRAEHSDLQDEWGLLCGDLAASDFSFYPKAVIEAGIAYYEFKLQEVVHELQRRARATVHRADAKADIDWQARFDAMRRADIVDALESLGVDLKKRGREWTGSCPFHQDRSPSFSVSQDKGVWVCFSCNRGGDLVAFVAMRNDTTRVEALQFLETMVTV
jgi:hypothetical protein